MAREHIAERGRWVGQWIKTHHHGGKVTAEEMRAAQAAYRAAHGGGGERKNPDDGYFATEVVGSTIGTVLGLGIFVAALAWLCTGKQTTGNPYVGADDNPYKSTYRGA